jgi:hypothetical protein
VITTKLAKWIQIYLNMDLDVLNMFTFLKKINNLLTKANDPSDKFKDLIKCGEETFNKLVRYKLLNLNGRRFSFNNNKKSIINKL